EPRNIVLIHGLWMTPRSWEPFRQYCEEYGYRVLAPPWPRLLGEVMRPETELYLGLVHRDDMAGNTARLVAARRHVQVDGAATECGMARGDPERFPALLAAHAQTAELAASILCL